MVRGLMWAEVAAFTLLAIWMAVSIWKFSRGDKRYGDTARLVIFGFSCLLIYRDLRILFVDASDQAKLIMCVAGLLLCGLTALAARAYGRGIPLT